MNTRHGIAGGAVPIIGALALTVVGFALRCFDVLYPAYFGNCIGALLLLVLIWARRKGLPAQLRRPGTLLWAFAVDFSLSFWVFLEHGAVGGVLCLLGAYLPLALAAAALRDWLIAKARRSRKGPNEGGIAAFQTIGLVFYALLSFVLCWIRFFPYGTSPDTVEQWNQAHGLTPLSDVHAVTHTLFLKALFWVKDDYTIVIVVHLLMILGISALFSHWLLQRGAPYGLLFLLVGLSLSAFADTRAYFYPWKDTPYAFCVGLTVYELMRLAGSCDEYRPGRGAVLGLALAGVTLFRLNGILITGFIAVWFTVSCFCRRRFLALALCLAILTGTCAGCLLFAYGPMEARSPVNGFSVQTFGTGLAAIVEDGDPSQAELAEIGEILPLDWIEAHYSLRTPRKLIWDQDEIVLDPEKAVFNNRFVLAMGEHRGEVIRLYLRLLPRYWRVCLRSYLYGVRSVWSFGRAASSLFLENAAVMAMLALMCLTLWDKKRLAGGWIVLMPVLLNALSIAISTVTNEARYLQPTLLLLPYCVAYLLIPIEEKR